MTHLRLFLHLHLFLPAMFSREKLVAYQRAIEFVAWTQPLNESLPRSSVREQLDRASTSIPLNLAEGNVKFSTPDRARFLQIAQGSTVECAACIDVMIARRFKGAEEVSRGKELLEEIARMVAALLDRLGYRFVEGGARVREDGSGWE